MSTVAGLHRKSNRPAESFYQLMGSSRSTGVGVTHCEIQSLPSRILANQPLSIGCVGTPTHLGVDQGSFLSVGKDSERREKGIDEDLDRVEAFFRDRIRWVGGMRAGYGDGDPGGWSTKWMLVGQVSGLISQVDNAIHACSVCLHFW